MNSEKKSRRPREKKGPRAYVYQARVRYQVNGGERVCVAWVAKIRSAENPRGMYLARVGSREEALKVCEEYLKTGVVPTQKKYVQRRNTNAPVEPRPRQAAPKEKPAVKPQPVGATPAASKPVDRVAMMKAIWGRLK